MLVKLWRIVSKYDWLSESLPPHTPILFLPFSLCLSPPLSVSLPPPPPSFPSDTINQFQTFGNRGIHHGPGTAAHWRAASPSSRRGESTVGGAASARGKLQKLQLPGVRGFQHCIQLRHTLRERNQVSEKWKAVRPSLLLLVVHKDAVRYSALPSLPEWDRCWFWV